MFPSGPLALTVALLSFAALSRGATVPLSSLDLAAIEQEYGRPGVNVSVENHPLSIAGHAFQTGVGTHANSQLWIELKKDATRFTASVGVDSDAGTNGSVSFEVKGDGKRLWTSGVMRGGDSAKAVSVDLRGISVLVLVVHDGGDGISSDHADWAEAAIEYNGATPRTIPVPAHLAEVLTPKPAPAPRVNGPVVFGVRPGSPFLYSIPATGTRPMTFAADGLPAGLRLDPASGRIMGVLAQRGEYRVTLRARNALGAAARPFRIVVGDDIALTPPMGWNSWNCWGEQVDADKVLRSARALVASGLDQHGWTYVNIDDTWQGERGGAFHAIQPNPQRFPDMKGVCDTIHALGLKAGIYSTPWTVSYARRLGGSSNNPEGKWDAAANLNAGKNGHTYPYEIGKYHFARNDAKQWAEWGFDYLKYDWGPVQVADTREMEDALRATGRDVVYSLSNNGLHNIFGIIGELSAHANSWRTTDDISGSWGSMSSIAFNQDQWAPFQRPGHYNDADMLVVGHIGWGNPRPTSLTPDEQYTHVSLYCLLGAPLLLGCDLEKLDDFTLGLLTNDEVLEVDQDPLCKQATHVASHDNLDVYAKPLADGSVAVGLFNRTGDEAAMTVQLTDLKIAGKRRVHDLWRQQDLGIMAKEFKTNVPTHGVVLVRLIPTP